MGFLYLDNLRVLPSLSFSQEEICHSELGGQWSRWVALMARQGGQTCGGAALPSPSWSPFLHRPLNTALSLCPSGERVLQRQLCAREQPQALPVFAVCALRGGRAGPQQVCGQQPGEVLWIQRRLQVLWWAWQVGLGPGTEAGPLLLTPALASCVAGAWLRMQGMSPLSSTRLSLTTQMVREGGWGQSKARFRGLFPIPNTIQAPGVAGIRGQAATGKTESRSLCPLGILGPQKPHGKNRPLATHPGTQDI